MVTTLLHSVWSPVHQALQAFDSRLEEIKVSVIVMHAALTLPL